jgi:hypothetical protein
VRPDEVLARIADQAHMWSMSGRPCNPGNDFKGLWRAFLGDLPMPQCEAPSDAQAAEDLKSATSEPIQAEPTAKPKRDP